MSSPRSDVSQTAAYAKWAPWCALVLGSLLAILSVWQYRPAALPPGAAALVNDTVITAEQWQKAIAAVNQDRRSPLDSTAEQEVLQRLIHEELLLQLAQEMGLTHSLPEVRGRLVQATMAALSQGMFAAPSDAQLKDFMADQPHLFQDPEKRLVRAWRSTQGETAEPVALPSQAMTQRQLQRWLGQSLAEAAFASPAPGRLDYTLTLGEAEYALEVVRIEPATALELDAINRERVMRLYEQDHEEEQLARALRRLAAEATILRAPQL